MIGAALAWLTGRGARALLKQLAGAVADRENAATEQARIAAHERVEIIKAELESQRVAAEVRKATAGQWEMRLIVFAAGFPAAAHFACVCLVSAFPGTFPGWTVHALPAPMDQWQGSIILSLFGLSAVKLIGAVVARR